MYVVFQEQQTHKTTTEKLVTEILTENMELLKDFFAEESKNKINTLSDTLNRSILYIHLILYLGVTHTVIGWAPPFVL